MMSFFFFVNEIDRLRNRFVFFLVFSGTQSEKEGHRQGLGYESHEQN